MLKNTSFLTNTINKKSKYSFLSLFCITMLIAVVTLPSITIHKSSFVYAQTPLALKTFDIKSKLGKKVIKLGDSERLKITVKDKQNHQPVSGTFVRIIVTYAGIKTLKETAAITDINGNVFFNIPISKNSLSGSYSIDVSIGQTGYNDASFSTLFAAIGAHVPDTIKCSHHHHHHNCFA
jgi:hypothetical protein